MIVTKVFNVFLFASIKYLRSFVTKSGFHFYPRWAGLRGSRSSLAPALGAKKGVWVLPSSLSPSSPTQSLLHLRGEASKPWAVSCGSTHNGVCCSVRPPLFFCVGDGGNQIRPGNLNETKCISPIWFQDMGKGALWRGPFFYLDPFGLQAIVNSRHLVSLSLNVLPERMFQPLPLLWGSFRHSPPLFPKSPSSNEAATKRLPLPPPFKLMGIDCCT